MARTTQTQLLMTRRNILDNCIQKRIKCKEGAELLGMHEKSFLRLKARYSRYGDTALLGRKPGPRNGTAPNRTPDAIADALEELARLHPEKGPLDLAETLEEKTGRKIHPVTAWRILKRRKVRYSATYKRWKEPPNLYCLEEPGEELQLDACYPFGRHRKIVSYDAIDDCSRWVYGKSYSGTECNELAIRFIDELIARTPFRIRRIRSDNRLGKTLKAFCESRGIELVLNPPYTPEHNGKIERFHRTLKREFFWKYIRPDDPLETINYLYTLWQGHYNCERPHGGLGMNRLTPYKKLLKTTFYSLLQSNSQKVTGSVQQYKN